jgi:hypothetical protein
MFIPNREARLNTSHTIFAGSLNTSHTILAGTLQGGTRNECAGNSTAKTPESHSRDARRKALNTSHTILAGTL